jgi:HD-GYP domain-containing protein (c-di-GMP phosphodiesterase class II)
MNNIKHVRLFDLILCLSSGIDLVSPSISNHNKKVAVICSFLADELNFPVQKKMDVIIAASLHDVGALSLRERLDLLNFDAVDTTKHEELGYRHIKSFVPFAKIAEIVKYHHVPWVPDIKFEKKQAPIESNLIHLADRLSVLIKTDQDLLSQKDDIIEKINEGKNKLFAPEYVDAFRSVSEKEVFWFTVNSPSLDYYLSKKMSKYHFEFDPESLFQFIKIFGRVIDFRSHFTAVHSSRVSKVAESLAHQVGLDDDECRMMRLAGYLHDLGKLAVSAEILDKPSPLSSLEWNIMKSHSFYTYQLLDRIDGFQDINHLASYHHEKLNGSGYPFHRKEKELSKGDKIMVVADIFTALTENRPYRKGLKLDESNKIMTELAQNSCIDTEVVEIMKSNAVELEKILLTAEDEVRAEYQDFIKDI